MLGPVCLPSQHTLNGTKLGSFGDGLLSKHTINRVTITLLGDLVHIEVACRKTGPGPGQHRLVHYELNLVTWTLLFVELIAVIAPKARRAALVRIVTKVLWRSW